MINVNNQRGTDSYYVGSAIFSQKIVEWCRIVRAKIDIQFNGFDLPLILFFSKYKKFIEVSMRAL